MLPEAVDGDADSGMNLLTWVSCVYFVLILYVLYTCLQHLRTCLPACLPACLLYLTYRI